MPVKNEKEVEKKDRGGERSGEGGPGVFGLEVKDGTTQGLPGRAMRHRKRKKGARKNTEGPITHA